MFPMDHHKENALKIFHATLNISNTAVQLWGDQEGKGKGCNHTFLLLCIACTMNSLA